MERRHRTPKRLLAGGATVVGLVGAAGAAEKRRLRAAHPPPGQLVDVGGHRLHLIRQGAGSPPVVLEAGSGAFSTDWEHVQPRVAADTVAYDRAGLGFSEPGPAPRTGARILADLRMALTVAGVGLPRVLVGHSLGALLVRLYAYTHPEEVAGLVLVDPAHEDQFDQVDHPEAPRPGTEGYHRRLRRQGTFARAVVASGLPALLTGLAPGWRLPEAMSGRRRAVFLGDTTHVGTAIDEGQRWEGLAAEVREARHHLGDLPVRVLTHGRLDDLRGAIPLEAQEAMDEVCLRLQRELLGISSDSRQIVAEDCGHFIQTERPDLVVDAIHDVIAARHERAAP
jgi:pimeloyl-ACP methyl ester carboxylesterase